MSQVTVFGCLGSRSVSMQTGAGAQTIFTVPTGKTARISHVVIRSPSGSLSGATVINFSSWRQSFDVSSMTAATDYMVIDGNNAKYSELAAAATFQITPSTGTAGATTATIEVFGYLT